MEVFLQGQRVIAPRERIHPTAQSRPISLEEGMTPGGSGGSPPAWRRRLPRRLHPAPLTVLWSYCVPGSRGSGSAAGGHPLPPGMGSNRQWPTPQRAHVWHPSSRLFPGLGGWGVFRSSPLPIPRSPGPAACGGAPGVHLGGAASPPRGAPRPRRLAARRVPAAEPGEERPRLT